MMKCMGTRLGAARRVPSASHGIMGAMRGPLDSSRGQGMAQEQQTRGLSSTESSRKETVKKYVVDRAAYREDVKAVRKQYIEEMRIKREEEQARQAAERARVLAEKKKRLLAKRLKQFETAKRVAAERKVQKEEYRRYLEEMQRIRDEQDAVYKNKQKNLVQALTNEATLWIDGQNAAEKINEKLFTLAGKSTASSTRHSRNWQFMALGHTPNFANYDEDLLFDEREDLHFLTDKSPWNQEIVIPEGHELYTPGPVRMGLGGGAVSEDEEAQTLLDDSIIYFEDGIYRKSLIGQVYEGNFEDMNPMHVRDEELEELRDLAEKYEERLAELQVEREVEAKRLQEEEEEEGQGEGKGGRRAVKFDPAIFDEEAEEEEGQGKKKDDGERKP